jgi:hypothetical protein
MLGCNWNFLHITLSNFDINDSAVVSYTTDECLDEPELILSLTASKLRFGFLLVIRDVSISSKLEFLPAINYGKILFIIMEPAFASRTY